MKFVFYVFRILFYSFKCALPYLSTIWIGYDVQNLMKIILDDFIIRLSMMRYDLLNKMIRYGSWSNLMDQIIYDWTTSCTIVGQRDICLSVCRHYTSWDIVLMTDWYYIMFNQDGMSPISLAASQGHTFCFRDFVKAGADIEAKDVVSKRV